VTAHGCDAKGLVVATGLAEIHHLFKSMESRQTTAEAPAGGCNDPIPVSEPRPNRATKGDGRVTRHGRCGIVAVVSSPAFRRTA